uniref:Uncharacterized protein n=1 Tax=Fagus sylvatica TaxID=28930 RepID=A0A2N9G456_FAGSY
MRRHPVPPGLLLCRPWSFAPLARACRPSRSFFLFCVVFLRTRSLPAALFPGPLRRRRRPVASSRPATRLGRPFCSCCACPCFFRPAPPSLPSLCCTPALDSLVAPRFLSAPSASAFAAGARAGVLARPRSRRTFLPSPRLAPRLWRPWGFLFACIARPLNWDFPIGLGHFGALKGEGSLECQQAPLIELLIQLESDSNCFDLNYPEDALYILYPARLPLFPIHRRPRAPRSPSESDVPPSASPLPPPNGLSRRRDPSVLVSLRSPPSPSPPSPVLPPLFRSVPVWTALLTPGTPRPPLKFYCPFRFGRRSTPSLIPVR